MRQHIGANLMNCGLAPTMLIIRTPQLYDGKPCFIALFIFSEGVLRLIHQFWELLLRVYNASTRFVRQYLRK